MKFHNLILTFLLAATLTGCHKGADLAESLEARRDSVNLVLRISQQNRLYIAQYQIHKIVTHDDLIHLQGSFLGHSYDQKINLGDRKIAIPMDVTLKAYVDFSNFSQQNVERSGDMIHIILPDPQITVTSSQVDHKNVQQYTSLFRSDYSDAEMTEFTRQGVEDIVSRIPELGLLETAQRNAAETLIPLLVQMGYAEDQIVVTFRDDLKNQKPTLSSKEGDNMTLKY